MTLTPHLGIDVPTDHGDTDVWGPKIRNMMNDLDAAMVFSAAKNGIARLVPDGYDASPTDNSAAFATLVAAANAEALAANRRAVIKLDGFFGLMPNAHLLERVGLIADDKGVGGLVNLGTTYGALLSVFGSKIAIKDCTIDGQIANQVGAVGGGAAVVFSKPAGTTGSGSFAGGLLLTAAAGAGATSLTVATSVIGVSTVPVLPGDLISIFDGTNYEVVRVSQGFAGGTTIPLTSPLQHAYATSANVCVFSTGNLLDNCEIRAVGFEGVEMWHMADSRVSGNDVFDAIDTGIGTSAGGSRYNEVVHNVIEGVTRFGVFIDGAEATFAGTSGHIKITHNTIRLLPGGTDPGGSAFECIGTGSFGAVDMMDVSDNVCDISRAGLVGMAMRLDGSRNHIYSRNLVYGGGRAGTAGIEHYDQGAATADCAPQFDGNILHSLTSCMVLEDLVSATVRGGVMYPNAGGAGIGFLVRNDLQQRFDVDGVRIIGGSVGISEGGPVPTQSPEITVRGAHMITGQSFLAIGMRSQWHVYRDDIAQTRADTSGATLAALETEVNFLKARLREAGIGLKP